MPDVLAQGQRGKAEVPQEGLRQFVLPPVFRSLQKLHPAPFCLVVLYICAVGGGKQAVDEAKEVVKEATTIDVEVGSKNDDKHKEADK